MWLRDGAFPSLPAFAEAKVLRAHTGVRAALLPSKLKVFISSRVIPRVRFLPSPIHVLTPLRSKKEQREKSSIIFTSEIQEEEKKAQAKGCTEP